MQMLSAERPQLIRWRLGQAGSRREWPEMASSLHNTQQLTLLCTSALQRHKNCSFGGRQKNLIACCKTTSGSVIRARDPTSLQSSFPILKMGAAPPSFRGSIIDYNLLNTLF